MQILDSSQIMLSAMFGSKNDLELDIENIRGMMLYMIRNLNFKFRRKYGQLVIAADGANPYWRKDLFPHYKSNRKKIRDNDGMDWEKVREIIQQFKSELNEYFPYRFIEIPHVEADDIIAALTLNRKEPVLIISSDKDYIQLHDEDVQQFNPIQDKFVKHDSPDEYLVDHIIRGDRGDGIPNVLSDSDTFIVEGKRQTTLTKTLYNELKTRYLSESVNTDWVLENFKRNEKLIDLKRIPPEIVENIIHNYESQTERTRKNMRLYFATHGLSRLSRSLGEF